MFTEVHSLKLLFALELCLIFSLYCCSVNGIAIPYLQKLKVMVKAVEKD
jgi:hypothetical protein